MVKLITEDVRRTQVPMRLEGNVEVMGTIKSGAKMLVDGDIAVFGNVEDAGIEAVGDVLIDGGFLGTGAGRIVCRGSFKARFVQNQRIEAVGNINVEKALISSRIFSSGDVVLAGSDGTIIGGEIHAFGKVEAKIIGSPGSVTTRISVGIDPLISLKIQELERRAMALTARRMDLLKNLRFVSKGKSEGSGDEEVADLQAATDAIQADLMATGEQISELRMSASLNPDATVIAHEASHPPLKISICSCEIVNDTETGPVVYRLLGDHIVPDTQTLGWLVDGR